MQPSIPKVATALICLRFVANGSAAVAWRPCALDGVQGKSECTTISVAEDRAKPNGRRIELRIARLLTLSQNAARDPVFVLQGGPGQSAVKLAKFYGGEDWSATRSARSIVLQYQASALCATRLTASLEFSQTCADNSKRSFNPSYAIRTFFGRRDSAD